MTVARYPHLNRLQADHTARRRQSSQCSFPPAEYLHWDSDPGVSPTACRLLRPYHRRIPRTHRWLQPSDAQAPFRARAHEDNARHGPTLGPRPRAAVTLAPPSRRHTHSARNAYATYNSSPRRPHVSPPPPPPERHRPRARSCLPAIRISDLARSSRVFRSELFLYISRADAIPVGKATSP
jgi:hypothetical protein